jgi:hypothetical protein
MGNGALSYVSLPGAASWIVAGRMLAISAGRHTDGLHYGDEH